MKPTPIPWHIALFALACLLGILFAFVGCEAPSRIRTLAEISMVAEIEEQLAEFERLYALALAAAVVAENDPTAENRVAALAAMNSLRAAARAAAKNIVELETLTGSEAQE